MTLMEKAHATIPVSAVQELSQENLELITGGWLPAWLMDILSGKPGDKKKKHPIFYSFY